MFYHRMFKLFIFVGCCSMLLGFGNAQEKREDKKRGFLPANFGKLGLSNEQKQKIYSIQAKYKSDIDELNKKVKKASDDQRSEIYSVLSNDQKEKLKEITGFDKKDPSPKTDKKTDLDNRKD